MATMKECPVCGIRVKLENIEGHIKKVHPSAKVDAVLSEDDKTSIKIAKKKVQKTAQPFEDRERKRWIGAGLVIAVIVVALVFYLSTLPVGGPGCDLEGEDAILFTRGDVDGVPYDLNAHIGSKPILIEFFYTQCSACLSMAPVMDDLYAYYEWGAEVEFVAISSDSRDSTSDVRNYRDAHGSNWTFIWDSSTAIASDYCVPGTPTFVLIDTDGTIAKWWYKTRDYNTMISIINPVVQG